MFIKFKWPAPDGLRFTEEFFLKLYGRELPINLAETKMGSCIVRDAELSDGGEFAFLTIEMLDMMALEQVLVQNIVPGAVSFTREGETDE